MINENKDFFQNLRSSVVINQYLRPFIKYVKIVLVNPVNHYRYRGEVKTKGPFFA